MVGQWRLRALQITDAEAWLAIVRDPELRRLTSWSIETVEEMRANVVSYVEGPRALVTRRWAIVDGHDEFCGTCGFKTWDRGSQAAELSYELALERRGHGAMSAIASAVVAHGFEQMNLEVIRALVMVENTASNRLLERLGFRQTGTLPEFRRCGGILRDFYRYERVR